TPKFACRQKRLLPWVEKLSAKLTDEGGKDCKPSNLRKYNKITLPHPSLAAVPLRTCLLHRRGEGRYAKIRMAAKKASPLGGEAVSGAD
ncbi:MAG: hypothetical protein II583_08200, partial [Oscillospiraceae bacterium]|nr:hypothetical protein [Oscillospiraceae bacterium]